MTTRILDYECPHARPPRLVRGWRWLVERREELGIAALAMVSLGTAAWPRLVTHNGEVIVFLYWMITVWALFDHAIRGRKNGKPLRRRSRIALTIAAIASASLIHAGTSWCPHAHYLDIGPITIVTEGRACRNKRINWVPLAPCVYLRTSSG